MSDWKILLGIDASPGSMVAVEWCARLARDLGATVVAVHVYEPLAHLDEVAPDRDFHAIRDEIRHALDTEWSTPLSGVELETRVLEGRPHEVILREATQGFDLIVLGARRLGPIREALGSTSHRVVHDATIPVTIIHPDFD
jgi:nucleotide-binding universal stress UspA family protein